MSWHTLVTTLVRPVIALLNEEWYFLRRHIFIGLRKWIWNKKYWYISSREGFMHFVCVWLAVGGFAAESPPRARFGVEVDCLGGSRWSSTKETTERSQIGDGTLLIRRLGLIIGELLLSLHIWTLNPSSLSKRERQFREVGVIISPVLQIPFHLAVPHRSSGLVLLGLWLVKVEVSNWAIDNAVNMSGEGKQFQYNNRMYSTVVCQSNSLPEEMKASWYWRIGREIGAVWI